ncbi:MAG: hypothetical protein A3C46_05020 [Deltaproteobacteria bacterium RIFCSPHIGHO2_02_FULL_44_16]|nr:MAG: hypothetical protein A3C46_05020 [Deltaproteobacteria bacterium RIFCSPHIGHO2_02_FULL_44_16]
MELVSLATIQPGQKGTIKQITGEGLFFTRLRELGMRPETAIAVVRRAPFGGALHVRLGDQNNIAVSIQEASQILLAII